MVNERSRRAFIAGAGTMAGAAPLLIDAAAAQTRAAPTGDARISVDAYGAKGDGTSDDSAAIQSAIDAAERAGGGVVTLGRKTYLLNNEVKLDPTKTSLSGNRTVLVLGKQARAPVLLRIAVKEQGGPYGQGTQFIEGVEFAGPGASVKSTAILLSTAFADRSSRIAIRNCVIHDFETGADHHDRCYLTQYYSVQIYNTRTGMAFTSNQDAGENTSLFGCSIFNSDISLSSPAVINLFCYGCSFDYCRQWFVGAGNIQFFGCWFEKHRPMQPVDYPFELSGCKLLISGGGLMTSGNEFEQGNRCTYFFMTKSRHDQVTIDHASAWNLRTASGELVGGEGTVELIGLASVGRLFVPVATKNDAHHNLYGTAGGFEEEDVRVPCWLEADGVERIDRRRVAWAADGRRYAEASIATSEEAARSGRRSLCVTKGIGAGTALSFHLLAPVRPGDALGLRFWWRSRVASDAQFWMQIFFAQVAGAEGDGVPRITDRVFWGEAARNLSAGASDWVAESFNSYDVQEDSPARCRAPAWATHVYLAMNLFAAPEGAKLFIDDLGGFRM